MVKQKFLTSEMVYYKAVTLDGSKARLALGGSSKSKKSYRDATIKSLSKIPILLPSQPRRVHPSRQPVDQSVLPG